MEEAEFLILQCPACERSVKIKTEAAGTRMGCPYCKAPIEVPEPEPEDLPPPQEEDAEEQAPLVFRRIEGTESKPDAASPTSPSADPAPKGERRKHRKRHNAETLDWDEAPGERTSRETAAGLGADDDSSEFLEMDPDTPGGVRLKRVRRKKVLTGKDKFVRGVTIAVIMVAVIMTGVIIYSAVIQTTKVIAKEVEIDPEVKAAISKAKASADPMTEQLTSAEEELAAATLMAFLNASSTEERVAYVRNGKELLPVMKKWYADNPEEAAKEWPDGTVTKRKKIVDGGRYFIILAVDFATLGTRVLALEQLGKGDIKLDWQTAVGYQPMPLEKFKSEQPRQPTKFWVKVKPSQFYNFGFTEDRYHAVELSYPGHVDFKLNGYIDRKQERAPSLISQLELGIAPSLIVELKFPEGEIKDPSQVEVSKILSNTWWE